MMSLPDNSQMVMTDSARYVARMRAVQIYWLILSFLARLKTIAGYFHVCGISILGKHRVAWALHFHYTSGTCIKLGAVA
jgi:hypothetical protein